MINAIDHVINIDLANKINMNKSIYIKKNDTNSHKFVINIFNSGINYDLTGTTSRIYFQKADDTKVFLDCTLDNALTGKLSCLLTTQALSYAGLVASEITIYGTAGEILTSVTFNFTVSEVIRDDAAIQSTSEFTALTNALNAVNDAVLSIPTVEALNVDLQNNIVTGDALDITLKDDISTGNILDAELKGDITTGDITDAALKADIIIAGQNEFATEITNARGGEINLDTRLDKVDTSLAETVKKGELFINVKDYGAKGDAVTDDIIAFNNAISALPPNGGVLLIPNGRYVFSASINISNKDVTIIGDGIQLSQLFFTNSDGIVYSTTNLFTDGIVIKNLSVVTLSDNLYKGISISYPSNSGSPWVNSSIESVMLSGSTTVAEYNAGSNVSQTGTSNWSTGIYLLNSAVSHIRDCVIRASSYVDGNSDNGIHCDGYTVDILIEGCKTYAVDVGIRKSGSGEGLIINHCMFINGGVGVFINEGEIVLNGVYASIHACHIAYFKSGIIAIQHPQVFIDKCLMYKNGADTSGSDVTLGYCSNSHVTNNTLIAKIGTGASNGIVAYNSENVLIEGNIIHERNTGIWIKSTCIDAQINNNKIDGNTTNVLDQSTTTFLQKKTISFSQVCVLTAGQTTIDITLPRVFVIKPSAGIMTTSTGAQFIIGFYDYDSATSTNLIAQFKLKRIDNVAITAESIRFNITIGE